MSVKISSTVKLKPAANIIYEELVPNIANILYTGNLNKRDTDNIENIIKKHRLTQTEEKIIMEYSYVRYQNSLYQQLMKNDGEQLVSEVERLNKLGILGKMPIVQRNLKANYVLEKFIDEYYPDNNNNETNKKNAFRKIQSLKDQYERSIARNNKAALRKDAMKTKSILGSLSSRGVTATKSNVLPSEMINEISGYSVATRKAGKRRKKGRKKRTRKRGNQGSPKPPPLILSL